MSAANNLQIVRQRIEEAALRAGRKAEEITLLPVSKKQPVKKIQEMIELGLHEFAENYAQELMEKQQKLPAVKWHFIGRLQRKKAKDLVGLVETIQSVDRVELVDSIDRIARQKQVTQKILVQVNIGDEKSKAGVAVSELEALLVNVLEKENLLLKGLMCLPPLTESERQARGYFSTCRQLFERLQSLASTLANKPEGLSMGTTSDFVWAIEEGATMVRVGTALFGERK